ncbi:MAG: membrane dipeptidase [Candidatus Latescibacterota bacterium]
MTGSPLLLPTLDAHNDSIILREVRQDPMDFADCDPAYHVDLPRMRQGGLAALFVMVGDSDVLQSLRLIDAVHSMCAAHPDDFALCLTAADVRAAEAAGRIGLVMSIEGQAMFAERIENVRNWHRLGVRIASLTHGEGNRGGRGHALQYDASHFGYLDPVTREVLRRRSKGLTPFARESLAQMARLRIPVDLAHANDTAFWETLEGTDGPVCYTHGNCYALCRHTRNCTDEMLRALAARGGVIGICFYGPFVDEQQPTLDRLADHFLYALEVAGEDHVGVGTDFDGIGAHQVPVIPDAAGLPALWEKLRERGVGEPALRKVARDNLLRLLP